MQRDIELRELREFGTNAVQQLGNLAAKEPDLTSTLQVLFSQVTWRSRVIDLVPRLSSRTCTEMREDWGQAGLDSGQY